MKKDKSNVFIIGVNMENSTPEGIAFEAAIKIASLTDVLIEKQKEEKK